ncbi:MAG: hypothetical protein KC501_35525 [Myxococcales bacterium]|nr:hypothetical protein [Myxococcales bacterium]
MLAWSSMATAFMACTGNRVVGGQDGSSDSGSTSMDGATTMAMDGTTGTDETGSSSTELPPMDDCVEDGSCPRLDLLFVIDNSGTMGDEQLALSNDVGAMVDELTHMVDVEGNPVELDVNIMVTTTDMGHPLCAPFQKPDYAPAEGAPIYTGCNARINRFTGLDPVSPVVIPEACTDNCPADITPAGPFIHFDGTRSNVPGDDVEAALACIPTAGRGRLWLRVAARGHAPGPRSHAVLERPPPARLRRRSPVGRRGGGLPAPRRSPGSGVPHR